MPSMLHSSSLRNKPILENNPLDCGVCSCLTGTSHDVIKYIIANHSYETNSPKQQQNIVQKGFNVFHTCCTHRYYLCGTKLIIKVDTQIITYLRLEHQPRTCKTLNSALELSEYVFDIQHFQVKEKPSLHCIPICSPLNLCWYSTALT